MKKVEVPLSWFGKTLWKFTPLYAELLALAICLRLIGLVEPFVFQVLIDRIIPFQREASLVVVVAVFAGVSIIHVGFDVLYRILNMLTANRVSLELGERIIKHYSRLPLGHSRKWKIGESLARMGETNTIRDFLVGTSMGTTLDLLFVVVYVSILFMLSGPLTLIVLISLPLHAAIYLGLGPILRNRLRKRFDTSASHQSATVEHLSGMATIKSLGGENAMVSTLRKTMEAALRASFRLGVINLVSGKLAFAIDRTITILIIFVGATLVFRNELSLGQLVAFHLLSDKIITPVTNFAKLWENWQNIKISRQRLGDIVNQPMEPFGELPQMPTSNPEALVLSAVSFSYEGASKEVVTDLNQSWLPNTLNLIVGTSGMGKSTIGRLAVGIDRPSTGEVLYGGNNLNQYDPHSVRNQLVYVEQDSFLFTGTVSDNVKRASPKASESEVLHALELAGAADLTETLQYGLETNVGERGSALSGGQRQRIAIARALLQKPKVLVLDEPTSALDETSRREIARGLERLKKQMTIIVITHSPEVFTSVDSILTMEKERE